MAIMVVYCFIIFNWFCNMDIQSNIEKARIAREMTTYIEQKFQRMPWKRKFNLNAKNSYWEILSFLYVNRNELISKNRCIRAMGEMSRNTAEYQINQLIDLGVLLSELNPHDSRAKAISLAPDTLDVLDEFFSKIEVSFQKED